MLCTLRTLLGLSFLSIVKWCLTMIYSEVDDGIKIAMKSSFERCCSKLQSNLSGWCWVGWHVGCNKIHSCPMHLPFSKHSNGSPIFKGKFGPRIQKQTSAGSIRFQNARLFGEHTQTGNTRKNHSSYGFAQNLFHVLEAALEDIMGVNPNLYKKICAGNVGFFHLCLA